MKISLDRPGFVDISLIADNIRTDIRYFGENNFVGRRIDGYRRPLALLTEEAAKALKAAAAYLKEKGIDYVIKNYMGINESDKLYDMIKSSL